MSTTNDSYLKIPVSDVASVIPIADKLLDNVQWKPSKQPIRKAGASLQNESIPTDEQLTRNISLIELAREISGGSSVLTAPVNKVLEVIRNAVCVAQYVAQQYVKRSGLDVLHQQNNAGKLAGTQQVEFNHKNTTCSAIALFVMATYVVHELTTYEEGKVSAIRVDFPGIPELSFRNPNSSFSGVIFHFAQLATAEVGIVENGFDLVKLAIEFFSAVAQEIHDKSVSLPAHETFTCVSYQLEDSDFTVKGFELIRHTATVSVEFRKIGFDKIVGNRRAKHMALRAAMILCCYDLKRKKNPFLELGSFPLVRMGFGPPGTGKSLLIAAIATKMHELCEKLGLPFLFWPMPATIVSTFQGGSAERMEDWMRRLADDDKVVFGPIDDAEANFMNRNREGVSAGVREVISVFLRNTEGASAIVRGNAIIDLYTNLPEIIDPAVLSRVQARFPIDGATSVEDFTDQDYLWWSRFDDVDPKFVGMKNGGGYKYLTAQKALANLSELDSERGKYEVKDEKIAKVLSAVSRKHQVDDHGFFAELYFGVKRVYPAFTSRDVRNIASAVDARVMDFDLPVEWFDDPALFYAREYDEKVAMLKTELRRNLKGLSFAEIRREEALRYLDTLAEISNVDFERRVEETVARIRISTEAERRIRE